MSGVELNEFHKDYLFIYFLGERERENLQYLTKNGRKLDMLSLGAIVFRVSSAPVEVILSRMIIREEGVIPSQLTEPTVSFSFLFSSSCPTFNT